MIETELILRTAVVDCLDPLVDHRGVHMFGLIALVAVCGAAYLGIRQPTETPIDRVNPGLWPYRHF